MGNSVACFVSKGEERVFQGSQSHKTDQWLCSWREAPRGWSPWIRPWENQHQAPKTVLVGRRMGDTTCQCLQQDR